ncbi:PAS domain-containing protein [Phenylobacterium sp. LjRoot219]|uniref:HWE histidine kinase domain-containing protein n=1 Tax=Phenylobacterium sp. LjRoot219 TaxID=3342283 RepID=UPI003ED06D06
MRAHDWSRSALGPPETWPSSLRSIVSLLLGSKFPMFVAWGPELRLLYNDDYTEILGDKHPMALGARFQDVWSETWSEIEPLTARARKGETIYDEDLPLVVMRYGAEQLTWFTFSYSPIEGEAGAVAGMFCTVVETTRRVRAESQRAFIARFDDRLRDLEDADQILAVSASLLGEHFAGDRVHWAGVDVLGDAFEVDHEWRAPGVSSLIGRHRLSAFGPAMLSEMSAGLIVSVEDISRDLPEPDDPAETALRPDWLVGALSVPLLRGGIWRAALCVHTLAPRRWRDDERQLIRDVAERAWTRAERARAEARVRDSEQRLRALVGASSDIIFRVSADWTELRELEGHDLPALSARPRVSDLSSLLPPEEQQRVQTAIQAALASHGNFELEHQVAVAGRELWIRTWAVPLRDARGAVVEWFGAASDVTLAHRARQELEETAERLQLATEAAEVGFWDLDPTTGSLIWSPRVKLMFGMSPDFPVTLDDFFGGVHPADQARVHAAFHAAVDPARRALYDVEYRTVGKDDRRTRWVAAKGRGYFNEAGECVRLIGTAIDITVRKAGDEHMRLMVNELNHRVKNSLATVQAITAQTLRRGEVPEAVRDALASRLIALAGAHDVLTDEKWSGAELSELAGQAAAPYISLSGTSPFEIQGPSVFLPPKTAIALALAFHELATNAAKYGALSAPGGSVRIAWRVERAAGGRELRLTWQESGGPQVRPPERTGFGTRLIQRGLASELQGQVSLDFRPTGLVCVVEAHLPDEPVDGWMADLQAG